ncbi:MAG: hypothetical protein IPJ78_15730 [Gemmatimonadetes bacterium]|nr:hypothetical protein [Gemmatimonadota bacterium]
MRITTPAMRGALSKLSFPAPGVEGPITVPTTDPEPIGDNGCGTPAPVESAADTCRTPRNGFRSSGPTDGSQAAATASNRSKLAMVRER